MCVGQRRNHSTVTSLVIDRGVLAYTDIARPRVTRKEQRLLSECEDFREGGFLDAAIFSLSDVSPCADNRPNWGLSTLNHS